MGCFEGMGACGVGEWSLGLILGDSSGDNGGSGVVVGVYAYICFLT